MFHVEQIYPYANIFWSKCAHNRFLWDVFNSNGVYPQKKILNHIKFLASLFELRIDEEGLFFGQKEAGKESYLIAANIVNFQPFIIVGIKIIKTKKIFLGKYFITWSVCVDNSVTTALKMCFYIPFFFTIKLCDIKFLISCFWNFQ